MHLKHIKDIKIWEEKSLSQIERVLAKTRFVVGPPLLMIGLYAQEVTLP